MPMMPRLDAADANMRSLLASEFRDLESALQKTTRRVRALLEERLRSFLRCVECRVLCRIAASVA
jgi:3-methyladenine DNA glycosylase AlkD